MTDASDNINYARASIDVLGMKPLSAGPYPLFGSGDSSARGPELVAEQPLTAAGD